MHLRTMLISAALIAILAGCGDEAPQPTPGASDGATPGIGAANTPPVAVTPIGGEPTVIPGSEEPAEVVRSFLTALQSDPSGQASIKFMSEGLRTRAEGGESVQALLGTQGVYRSFAVQEAEVNTEAGTATVTALLSYQNPLQRVFMLVRETPGWRIDSISPAQ